MIHTKNCRIVRISQISLTVFPNKLSRRLAISDLSQLVRVSIGWQLEDTFIEQIGLCHDEKNYATIW